MLFNQRVIFPLKHQRAKVVKTCDMQASLQYAQMKVQYKSKAVFDTLLRELRTAVAAKILYREGADESKRRREDDMNFEMLYCSFIVEFTSHLTLSAADHVHILWAHLQHTAQNLCSKIDEGFWCAIKPGWLLRCICSVPSRARVHSCIHTWHHSVLYVVASWCCIPGPLPPESSLS